MSAPTIRAAIYIRVSSEEQRDRETILNQRNFAERFCALHEIVPVGWYADDGVSGTIPLEQRPEGARLLQDARDGRLSVVYVYRVDRIARKARHVLNAVGMLEECEVRVASMTEPFDTSTPAGALFLTMLSGFADFERGSLLEKTMEGINRVVRAGAWTVGMAPFGYRVEGEHQDARLVISEDRINGLDLSEADVMRLIYRRCVEDNWSCAKIADELNALGIPPAYVRDGRTVRAKRTMATAARWSGSRVRNLIASTTYKGVHRYGLRSQKPGREIIERDVPAIVSVELWEAAQMALRARLRFSARNARHQYLLRGLIHCGTCGLGYTGRTEVVNDQAYYTCNGRSRPGGIYGAQGEKCPSMSVRGAPLEAAIWHDVEDFLRNPGPALAQLAEQMGNVTTTAERVQDDLARWQQQLGTKQGEKDSVIALYRRGRIDAGELDRQLDQVQVEEADLRARVDALQQQLRDGQSARERLTSAEAMLRRVHAELDGPRTFEKARAAVSALVADIRIDVVEINGKRRAKASVRYRFEERAKPLTVTAARTAGSSWR